MKDACKAFMLGLILLISAAALAACGGSAAEPAAPVAEAQAAPADTAVPPTEVPPTEVPPTDTPEPQLTAEERGREIFYNGGSYELYKPESACASCHSLDGTVSGEDDAGPSLLGVAARAGERVPGLSAADYLRQSIMSPSAFVAPTYQSRMTKLASKLLTEEELDDVVAFLLILTDDTVHPDDVRPAPEVELDLGMMLAEGNETRGRIAAISYRCLGCHADDEIAGYGPPFSSYEDLPPIMERGELRIADPAYEGQATTNQEYILESIFLPATYILPGEWPENMPNTYHSRLSDDDLANIMIWLATFE